jgi:SnoaL-like domain
MRKEKTDMADRHAIADLMTGWMHRDLGEWDLLRDLFAPDAHIEITWFSGAATDFVDGSTRMGATDIKTKHLIAAPVIQFSDDGTRAVSETNAIVIAESGSERLGAQAHSRFIDQLEKEGDAWRIADRRAVYDFASFTFPVGIVDIDRDLVEAHPAEYSALAYILTKGGFPVEGTYPTRGSDAEHQLKNAAAAWLEKENDR